MADDRIIRNENTMDPAEAAAFTERYRLLRNEQTAIYELYARAHRLSVQELEVLTALWLRYPGWCTQSDIQLKLFAPQQRVSAIIKKFRRMGFVSLTPSPTDGRNQLVQLSPDGEKYARTIVQPVIAAEREAVSALSADAALTILEGARRMHHVLSDHLTPMKDTHMKLIGATQF